MRCFEIQMKGETMNLKLRLNNNMRCFEILPTLRKKQNLGS